MAKVRVVPIAVRNPQGNVTWKTTSEELAPEIDALQKENAVLKAKNEILEAENESKNHFFRVIGKQVGRALPAARSGDEDAA